MGVMGGGQDYSRAQGWFLVSRCRRGGERGPETALVLTLVSVALPGVVRVCVAWVLPIGDTRGRN